MDVLEHWSVDFYDFTVPDQLVDDSAVARAALSYAMG